MKKTCFVAMPSYGLCVPGAVRGIYRASDGKVETFGHDLESSLLAQSFNIFWAAALNACRTGRRVDYFAMIHADVVPEDFWLDRLIEELDAHRLDVCSALIPIKSSKGLTSTAYEADPPEDFRVGGRITMTEAYRLPPTFTSEHVGRPVLMNTGLWVCRFDPAWAKHVCFTIRDRIVEKPDGSYEAEVMSEDWDVSRQFRRLGLRIGITRRVKVGHRGAFVFGNDKPWGTSAHDETLSNHSIIP